MLSHKKPPPFIWRLSKFQDLSGRGGLRVPGRWHTSPKSILYCSADPHTAYLEMLRQFGDEQLFPDSLNVLKIRVPAGLKMEVIAEADLDPSWAATGIGFDICQPIGDEWLLSARTPLLEVPSAAGGQRCNVLVNSAHPDTADLIIDAVIGGHPFPDFVRLPSAAET